MFAVLIARNTDEHLHGYISRFFSEIEPGIYLGITARNVVEQLWEKVTCSGVLKDSEARFVLIASDHTCEQGFSVRRAGKAVGEVYDVDGVSLFGRRIVGENR